MTTLRHERYHGDLERFAQGLKSGEFYVSDFDPALIQELRNHLENPMSTAINPGCTCGAANFGPGAAHMENCYISLAKEADAVQGVPVQQVGSNPVNPPAPADDLYPPAERQRTTYTNNGLATSGDFPPKLTFTIAPPATDYEYPAARF